MDRKKTQPAQPSLTVLAGFKGKQVLCSCNKWRPGCVWNVLGNLKHSPLPAASGITCG